MKAIMKAMPQLDRQQYLLLFYYLCSWSRNMKKHISQQKSICIIVVEKLASNLLKRKQAMQLT
jgi:hypothetical protein